MLDKFIVDAIKRHLDETFPLISQLDDTLLHSKPLPYGRALGEIIYHMLRSFEYYLRGLVEGIWEPSPRQFDAFTTHDSLLAHWHEVRTKVRTYLSLIMLSDFTRVVNDFNRPATFGEILLEMLEHSIHHRGQLTVYLRLLDIEPAKIEYII